MSKFPMPSILILANTISDPKGTVIETPRLSRHAVLLSSILILVSPIARASELSNGDLKFSIDTTVSLGATLRVEERARDLLGPTNGGTGGGTYENIDDGNANYGQGSLTAAALRATTEMELNYKTFGAFFRASGFFDMVNSYRSNLSPEARKVAGRDLQILDGYLRWNGTVAERSASVRLGYQVINWGESLFYQGGLSAANGIDIRRLRVPGTELRDALLPNPALFVSVQPFRQLSIEGYVTAQSNFSRVDACGTVFSTTDFFCEGGPKNLSIGQPFTVSRSADRKANGWFQAPEYGVALRYANTLLYPIDFGFYFMNNHYRLPLPAGRAPDTVPAMPAQGIIPTGFADYPSDIKVFGVSFNTNIHDVVVSGEYTYRPNMPLMTLQSSLVRTLLTSTLTPGGSTPGQIFEGWQRLPVGQGSLVLIKQFGQLPFASDLTLVGELAGTQILGTLPAGTVFEGPPGKKGDYFAWGYQVRMQLDYINALNGLNIRPQMAFSHDFRGNSPNQGNFVQDRTAFSVGVIFNYLNHWGLELSYSGFFGAGNRNIRRDKDFVSGIISYAF